MKNYFTLIVLVFILSKSNISAQQKPSDSLTMKARIDSAIKALDTAKINNTLAFEKLSGMKSYYDAIEKHNTIYSVVFSVVGLGSVLAVILLITNTRKMISDKVVEEFDSKKIIWKKIFSRHNTDDKVKMENEIGIICFDKAIKNDLDFLQKTDLKVRNPKVYTDINDVRIDTAEAYIIYNPSAEAKEEIMRKLNALPENNRPMLLFHMYKQRLTDDDKKNNFVASADFTSQLYGNLLNLLLFRESMKSRS